MYSIEILIPCTSMTVVGNSRSKFPPSPNARLHWGSKARLNKIWKNRVHLAVGKNVPKEPLTKCHAILTKYGTKDCDFDNFVSSMKPVIDGLVSTGIMIDDSTKHFSCDYRFEKVKRGKERIIIELTEDKRALSFRVRGRVMTVEARGQGE